MCGKRLKCWKTIPTFSRTWSTLVGFFSQIITIHCDVATRYLLKKVKARRKVDLPEPEGTDDTDNISFIEFSRNTF